MAAHSPPGTETTTTSTPTTRLVSRPLHIPSSCQSATNHFVVVPSQGVTVGNRLTLNVAAAMMASGRNR